MFAERQGNLLNAPVRAYVNAVNCVSVMGKGLALDFKKRYPAMFLDYEKACREKKLRPGQLHTWQESDGSWIINFPTKDHWKSPSKLEYIDAALPALVEFVQLNAIESIAIPALGCGLGGLDWRLVKPRIEKAFDVIPQGSVDVWLFGPQG
jgi:O-acetyl-ADP-ribose deacetylase (regulator of RNase III)